MEKHITTEEWEKGFDLWFFKVFAAEKGDSNRIRWQVKGKIRSILSAQQQKFRETLEGLKEDHSRLSKCDCIDIEAHNKILDLQEKIDAALSQLDQSQ